MNKELEALRGIISKFNIMRVALEAFYRSTQNVEPYIPDIDKELIVIEDAIKRLEEIDKLPKTEFYTASKIELNNESDKKLKALEIIQKKRVNVDMLMEVKDTNIYNGFACNSGEYRKLTQEEFSFLKEVLL